MLAAAHHGGLLLLLRFSLSLLCSSLSGRRDGYNEARYSYCYSTMYALLSE
jgi:hypothetical protein